MHEPLKPKFNNDADIFAGIAASKGILECDICGKCFSLKKALLPALGPVILDHPHQTKTCLEAHHL